MHEVGIETYEDYRDQLEVTPGEFTDLFNTILINVTGFYRDRPAWDYVLAGRTPARASIAGRTLRPPAARCRTTKTEAGSSGGSPATTRSRAWTPPAEAPTTTMSR
jgi:hypothetical protein